MAFMQDRDAAMIRVYGDNYWSRQIIEDPAMAAALKFLRNLIGESIAGRISRFARIQQVGQ